MPFVEWFRQVTGNVRAICPKDVLEFKLFSLAGGDNSVLSLSAMDVRISK